MTETALTVTNFTGHSDLLSESDLWRPRQWLSTISATTDEVGEERDAINRRLVASLAYAHAEPISQRRGLGSLTGELGRPRVFISFRHDHTPAAIQIQAPRSLVESEWFQSTLKGAARMLNSSTWEDDDTLDAPDAARVADALAFLMTTLPETASPPKLSPLPDGGVQVEWHRGGVDVELTFASSERCLYVRNKASGEELDESLSADRFRETVLGRIS